MAEIIPLLGSIAGALNVAVKASFALARLVQDWNDAPLQIAALADEIQDSRHTLRQLKALYESLGVDSTDAFHATAIRSLLRRADPFWSQLEEIIKSLSESSGARRKEKWMRSQHRIAALKRHLRELRFAAMEILFMCMASRAMRVESAVITNQSKQEAWFESTHNYLSDIRSRLEATAQPEEHPMLEEQATQPDIRGEIAIPWATQPEEQTMPEQQLARRGTMGSNATPWTIQTTQATIRHLDGENRGCRTACPCRCHIGKQYDQIRLSPLNGVLGSLCMMYSGWQLFGPRCNVLDCSRAQFRFIELTYSTPPQAIKLSITASFAISNGDPSIGLSLRRTTNAIDEFDSKCIITYVRNGNSSEMKGMLEKRSNSIYDVSMRSGWSALHFAVFEGQVKQAKLLLAAGADPFLEDGWGFPAIAWAFERILHDARSGKPGNALEDCLPISAFFEEFEFSHLELVVLGARPVDLYAELNKAMYRAEINAQDNLGKTPLHWASTRADAAAVSMLLFAGAQVNVRDKRGHTALLEACSAGSLECAEKLFEFGADLAARDCQGRSLIHIAVMHQGETSLLLWLLSNGADIDDSDNPYQSSPLGSSAASNNTLCCKALLEHGANIEHRDWEGDTPIIDALYLASHSCLQLLLDWGADYLFKRAEGQTLLHMAAKHGDCRSYEILATAGLKGLDANAKDDKSMTAREYFALRSPLPPGTVEAFNALIKSLDSLGSLDRVDSGVGHLDGPDKTYSAVERIEELDSSDDENFVDALEALDFEEKI